MYFGQAGISALIDRADEMTTEEMQQLGAGAKKRIREHYSWEKICALYEELFMEGGFGRTGEERG